MPSESGAMKVVAKCRPFTEEELKQGQKRIIKTTPDKISIDTGGKEQSFNFDRVYATEDRTNTVYHESCDSLVQKAVMGFNVSILGFGATGSGKTYVMSGNEEDPGIIPCLNKALFRYIEETRSKREIFVTVSFVEIMDEQMTDMLNPHSRDMKVREHPQIGIYVDGLSEMVVYSEEDLTRLYEQGNRARKMGATDMNAHRIRSSGVFTIRIEQKEHGSGKVGLRSSLTLVDLAGTEPDNINSNPVVRVLRALKKGGNVPFRDSKLTRLLQDTLSGNSMTLVLAMVSPGDKYYSSTLSTLELAQSARNLKTKYKVNLDETASVIAELRDEIARLREKVAKSPKGSKDDVIKMEELIKDLTVAKRQTWEERERLSQTYDEERKTNLANKGILEWVMDTMNKGNREIQEKIILLQKEKDQLTLKYKEKRKKVDDMKEELQKKIAEYSKIAESGKTKESDTKPKVQAIHELKEKLKRETEALKDIKRRLKDVQDKQRSEKETSQGSALVKGNAELRQMVEAEERKRMEADNKAMVAEEMERVKLETEHEKAEIQMTAAQGKTYSSEEGVKLEMELTELKGERSVVSLQIQTLQQEKERLKKDLDDVHAKQKEELEIQQLQHFQTFRQYREMFEEQKAVLESRYRKILEDSIQDAIFLSTRNNELVQENQELRQDMAKMKDKISTQRP